MPNLFLFGDSITWGSWDPIAGGWAQRLRAEIDRFQTVHWEFWCPTYNLGIPGDTTKDLDSRIENEIAARMEPGDETIVLIAIGINDSVVAHSAKSLSVDEYFLNLKSIVSKARKYTDKIGLLGLFPVDENLLTPVPWDTSISCTLKRVEEFNERCIALARECEIPALDFWKQLRDRDYRPMLFDGLHPNSDGHKWMYEAIREFLSDSGLLTVPFAV